MFEKRKQDPQQSLSWSSESESKKQLEAMWPIGADGLREQAVFLAIIPDINNEADFTINMLMAYGIPAFKQYNNEGALGKLIIGTSAYGASLYVPESMAVDAKALLDTPVEDLSDAEASDAE